MNVDELRAALAAFPAHMPVRLSVHDYYAGIETIEVDGGTIYLEG